MHHYDVLIAGAGPAGCAAAMVLAAAGIRVALVDGADSHPRRIGESLPGGTVRLLRRLGISGIGELMEGEGCKPCTANASAWGSDEWIYQDGLRNPEGGGWHVDRHRFNAALRNRVLKQGVPLHATRIGRVKKKE